MVGYTAFEGGVHCQLLFVQVTRQGGSASTQDCGSRNHNLCLPTGATHDNYVTYFCNTIKAAADGKNMIHQRPLSLLLSWAQDSLT